MTGEIISAGNNPGTSYNTLEVLVSGTRCYVEENDVKILGVLDRIVEAVRED